MGEVGIEVVGSFSMGWWVVVVVVVVVGAAPFSREEEGWCWSVDEREAMVEGLRCYVWRWRGSGGGWEELSNEKMVYIPISAPQQHKPDTNNAR